MADPGDGFQPCEMDAPAHVSPPGLERNMVAASLLLHLWDVGLDLLVTFLFFWHEQWGLFFCSAGVIMWSWAVSTLYVSFGGGAGNTTGDIDDDPPVPWKTGFFRSFVQIQIFAEAHRCIFGGGDTNYFHSLRLMQAILEAAPSTLVKLYALIVWSGENDAPPGTGSLLRLSVFASFASVGLGLAMWEQKVQFQTSRRYIFSVFVMRAFEIASRSCTVAVFACLTHPYGLWWLLLFDYIVMLVLIVRHQSVHVTYGLFVALPLVLVSLEPLVWRRDDHAVPKDCYYAVRVFEAAFMWVVIFQLQDVVTTANDDLYISCEVLALSATLGLYVTLPFVWCAAQSYELSRDATDWRDDGSKRGLQSDGGFTESDASSSGSERGESKLMPEE
eukprot:TRINITY_DN44355_c0_g1_i1.p1 TRINITY_DN44355_c0_g1~~TRINITY_DN44355_c0_g1_i1.p1  ORF type:complete len:388 (-),score=41.83 TRINITY_DN44355_c0_g1_i1:183-1346(-)